MPTATEAGTDLELIQHLDFDPEVSCIRCDAPAAWRWECRHCHTVGILCEPHHENEVRLIRWSFSDPACKVCSTHFPAGHPEECWIITPIGAHE